VILVDTSIWIDHLRNGNARLTELLERTAVVGHPWVIGELALGRLRWKAKVLTLLNNLPQATVATPAEVLLLIHSAELAGSGIGYVDAQLLAATRLTGGAALWTADRGLATAADRLGISA
jgi:predicted nucleic acid-binding protein